MDPYISDSDGLQRRLHTLLRRDQQAAELGALGLGEVDLVAKGAQAQQDQQCAIACIGFSVCRGPVNHVVDERECSTLCFRLSGSSSGSRASPVRLMAREGGAGSWQ